MRIHGLNEIYKNITDVFDPRDLAVLHFCEIQICFFFVSYLRVHLFWVLDLVFFFSSYGKICVPLHLAGDITKRQLCSSSFVVVIFFSSLFLDVILDMDDISFDAFVGRNEAVFLVFSYGVPFDVFSFVYPFLFIWKKKNLPLSFLTHKNGGRKLND